MDKQLHCMTETGQEFAEIFGELYDEWVIPIYRYCLSRTENTAVAEDITSQVFLSVYQSLPHYRHTERFAAWLFTIARNKIRDHYRKSRQETSFDQDIPDPHGTDLLEFSSHTEQIEKLYELVRALPEDQKELLLLRYVADLSFSNMAIVLKKREANVKKALYRLQKKLKEKMGCMYD